jgi:acetyltransferase-like isoleucine patch superfamily enzyme
MKALAKLAFRLLISLVYAAYRIEGVNALLLFMPARMIVPTLRRYGATIGEGVQIHSPLLIHNAADSPPHYRYLFIGDGVYIGRDVLLDLKAPICLHDYATLSMRCTLITHTDAGDRPPEWLALQPSAGAITLKRGAYLGANVTVLQGVTIGEKAVVGAGAVVNKDVPDRARVGGIPAKPLPTRQPDSGAD